MTRVAEKKKSGSKAMARERTPRKKSGGSSKIKADAKQSAGSADKKAAKKLASPEKLKARATKAARTLIIKKILKNKSQGHVFEKVGTLFNTFFHDYLPFELTNAQKRVTREIRDDIRRSRNPNAAPWFQLK